MSFAEKFKIKLKILCRRSLGEVFGKKNFAGEEKSFAETSLTIR